MRTIIIDRPYYPSLLLSPDESRDQDGPVEPTINGGVRVIPSDRNEWIITEATTNLFPNPSAVINTASVDASQATVSRRTDDGVSTETSFELTRNTTTGTLYFHTGYNVYYPITVGEAFTWSMQAKYTAGRAFTLRTYMRGATTGITNVKQESFTATGDWQHISVSVNPGDYAGTDLNETLFYVILAEPDGAVIGTTAQVTDIQLEMKAYPTPLARGDMGAGHSWTGTPHASASTREYSKVAVGKQINAWQTAEATTNLFANPSAAVNKQWLYPARGTLDRVEVPIGHSGYGFRYIRGEDVSGAGYVLTSQGSASGSYRYDIPIGSPITISMWLRNPNREVEFRAFFRDSSDVSLPTQSQYVSASAEWQRVELTYVVEPTAATISFYFILNGSVAGDLMESTDIQIEAKQYATPFASGDMGSGFSWTGTPHASSSVREQASVESEAWSAKASGGTMLVRYRQHSTPALPTNAYIVATGSTTDLFISPRANATARSTVLYTNGVSQGHRFSPLGLPTVPLGTPSAVAVTWDADTVHMLTLEGGRTEADISGLSSVDGTARIVLGMLSPTSSTVSNVDIESALFYDTPLSEAEITRLMNMPEAWTWDSVGRQVIRPQEVEISVSEPLSGANHVEMAVYETDRDNVSRAPLAYITDATPDWDIDRAGSKGRLAIASHRRVLRDGMWVATHIRVVPEVGDIIDTQTGHFRLDMPSADFDGSIGIDGGEKVLQDVVGHDIVKLLADANLPFTFYTPVGGHVMSDVKALIKIATMGRLGPNLLPNGSFEDNGAGWSTAYAGGITPTINWVSEYATPDGVNVFRVFVPRDSPAGSYVIAYSATIPIPSDAKRLMISGMFLGVVQHSEFAYIEFNDGSGWMPSQTRIYAGGLGNVLFPISYAWHREIGVGDVPEGAASFRVAARVQVVNPSSTSHLASQIDDIQVRDVTGWPIPDSRINLPPSSATATTRIQTTGGAKIGPIAINADRLAAISHHAINATAEGVLTTYPSRSLGDSTAARTYGLGDYRFRGSKRIEPGPNNRFSVVTAVKESFEEGVAPLVVTVWNDDSDDPWSVHKIGNVGKEILVQDAVDLDALEAAARTELARSTMQEELVIRVAPDPELTVYDVIEIEDGPEELQGRWLVQALSGVTPRAPYTEIHARRSHTSMGVTYG